MLIQIRGRSPRAVAFRATVAMEVQNHALPEVDENANVLATGFHVLIAPTNVFGAATTDSLAAEHGTTEQAERWLDKILLRAGTAASHHFVKKGVVVLRQANELEDPRVGGSEAKKRFLSKGAAFIQSDSPVADPSDNNRLQGSRLRGIGILDDRSEHLIQPG